MQRFNFTQKYMAIKLSLINKIKKLEQQLYVKKGNTDSR